MATIVKGLEMQLLMLKDLEATSLFIGEDLEACAECFQTLDLCLCIHDGLKATVWPVDAVIQKLRTKIQRLQDC